MVTFKPVVYAHQKRKDGTYNLKIRITYKGVSRHLPTTLSVSPVSLTKSLKIKQGGTLAKANELIERMRSSLDNLSPFQLDSMTVDDVVKHIKDRLTTDSFRLNFFAYGEEYMKSKLPQTARAYRTALNTFALYLGKRELDINRIDKPLLVGFCEWLDKQPRLHSNRYTDIKSTDKTAGKGRVARNLISLSAIFDSAKHKYNDEDSGAIVIPRSPFDSLKKRRPSPEGQKSLGVEMMQRIISYQTEDEKLRIALDAFIVSFALMGMNLADMVTLAPPVNGMITYNRKKTKDRRADKAEMRIRVPEELNPYIERLRGKGGKWLNVLSEVGEPTSFVNRHLRKFCKMESIPCFTFYAGRHSFATIAYNSARVDKATIDDCLTHSGGYRITDIYIEKDWDTMNDANGKVIALFNWA